jgi:hypothetical protein
MAIELTRQRKIVYGIVGILAVVLAVTLVVSQIVGRESNIVVDEVARVGNLTSDQANQPFDVTVLQAPEYAELNRSLVDNGRLPVPPPPTRGKPNPFGI